MSKPTLFIVCLFFGVIGGHYFVIGRIGRGVLYLLTGGLLGIGWIYDLIRIAISDDFVADLEKADEQRKEKRLALMVQKEEEAKKVEKLEDENIPYCPRCHSTHLTANKKGFGVGKAAAGAVIAGPLGLLAGGLGSRNVLITCLKCGYQFRPGK